MEEEECIALPVADAKEKENSTWENEKESSVVLWR